MLKSCKDVTPPPPIRRTPTLAPDQKHLIPILNHHIRRSQRHLDIFLIPRRNQFFLPDHFGVLKQFILEAVVDISLDDDELVVVLEMPVSMLLCLGFELAVMVRTLSHSHGSRKWSKVAGNRYFLFTLINVGRDRSIAHSRSDDPCSFLFRCST